MQVYYELPFYAFHSPIARAGKKIVYIWLKHHLGSYRETQTLYTPKAFYGWKYELHDHNATISKQFTEPNSILNQKRMQAESSHRTDKRFLPQHQTSTSHIMGTHPVAGPESPLQGTRLRSLITDYSYIISQGLNQKTL